MTYYLTSGIWTVRLITRHFQTDTMSTQEQITEDRWDKIFSHILSWYGRTLGHANLLLFNNGDAILTKEADTEKLLLETKDLKALIWGTISSDTCSYFCNWLVKNRPDDVDAFLKMNRDEIQVHLCKNLEVYFVEEELVPGKGKQYFLRGDGDFPKIQK